MNKYYYSGLPYSDKDSLSHYGILGQKWGVRRFQNSDGSLTSEGRERYGVKARETAKKAAKSAGDTLRKAANTTSKAAKKAGKAVAKAYKRRHPSLMSDEELIAFKKRLDLEKSYMDAKRELSKNRLSKRFLDTTAFITKESAKNFATTLATDAARNAAKNMFKSKSEEAEEKARTSANLAKLKYNQKANANLENYDKYLDNLEKIERNDRAITKLEKKSDRNFVQDKELDTLKAYNRKLEKSNSRVRRDFERNDAYLKSFKDSMKDYGFDKDNNQQQKQKQNQQNKPTGPSLPRKRHKR